MNPVESPPQPRTLRLSVFEGSMHAVMMGVGESYLGAFAVELGHRDLSLALLVTIPLLAGAIGQLFAGALAQRAGSLRRLVVIGALGQAGCHLGLLTIAITGDRRLWPLLVVKTLFWVSGAVIAPAWNAWMTHLTDGVDRQRYFARRSAAVNIALLVAFLFSGVILDRGRQGGWVLAAFGALFVVGLFARLGSAALLRLHDDSAAASATHPSARMAQAMRTSQWRVPVFIALVMLGAQVSVPFFTPFMLRDLRLDYTTFAGLSAISIFAKAVAFPLFDRLAGRIGLRAVLAMAGVGVAMVPLVWAHAFTLGHLVFAEALAGVVWAGFEFASFQLLMNSTGPNSRVEFFALAGTGSAVAQLGGSMMGSQLLGAGAVDYRGVFALSAALRAAPLALLISPWLTARAARLPLAQLFVRIVSVRPVGGPVRVPILADEPPVSTARPDPDAHQTTAAQRSTAGPGR